MMVFDQIKPCLPAETRLGFRTQCVEWMLLCVLEDKLDRLVKSSSDHEVLVEANSARAWNPWSHVDWLAFEVESQLQIRPYQHAIVEQLLTRRNSMIQLNMGLGKTSVLVPMLILELTKSKADVVRVNMLSSIINVVKDIYKSTLTASVHHVKVLVLPFQRDYPLDDIHADVLSEEMARCQGGRNCFLVTPQHRNSLLLRQHDVDVFVSGLRSSTVDIIDESDAILHQSFQLVYAVGDQGFLPNGQARWTMIETLLQIFAESNSRSIVDARQDATAVHVEASEPGAFPNLRLLAAFKAREGAVGRALCEELVTDPPYDFLWMKNISGEKKDMLVQIMSEGQMDPMGCIASEPLFCEFQSDILAARGCVACGLLFHCLRGRFRVNFGIDKSRRLLAVPFSASDTPKPCANYSHPDVPILYTCLSYFHGGLEPHQLKEAICCLQTLGPTAQETIYNSWIDSIDGGARPTKDLAKFDSFQKVDTDNTGQLQLMHRHLCRSMKLISFWMNNFVFPMETHIFPQRRVTSAFDLVADTSAIGFSGTDDSLLPTYVKQVIQSVPELRATNGMMIDRILECTRAIHVLDESRGELWKSILGECATLGCRALIDVSGLMAGVENRDAAVHVSKLLDEKDFRGVLYYDTNAHAWNVYEQKSQRHLPLRTAALLASECFAYFDESRCRGSDLALQTDAIALVTLEPGLTKDRFLQGCARMRQLRPNAQSLVLAGTLETITPTTTAKDVLELTIKNTAKEIRKGVVELYDRGTSHFNFPAPEDIDVSLEHLYGKPVARYDSLASYFDAVVEVEADESVERSALVQHCKDVGDAENVQVSELSEECERELENEEEEEEEEEVELQVASPYTEQDWSYSRAFSGSFQGAVPLLKISDIAEELLGKPVSNIHWTSMLLCTPNWRNTITSMQSSGRLYLRSVNAFLYCPDGSIVLISDYELDKLLPFWWRAKKSKIKLMHLSLSSSEVWLGPNNEDKAEIPSLVRTAAKLLRGYVNYSDEEIEALGRLFAGTTQRRETIMALLQLRHRTRFLERSDLDIFSLVSLDIV